MLNYEYQKKEAENGNKVAMYNLGNLYYKGEGIEKNLEMAFHWYQKAAKKGYNVAQNNLAVLYENGIYIIMEKE